MRPIEIVEATLTKLGYEASPMGDDSRHMHLDHLQRGLQVEVLVEDGLVRVIASCGDISHDADLSEVYERIAAANKQVKGAKIFEADNYLRASAECEIAGPAIAACINDVIEVARSKPMRSLVTAYVPI